MIVWVFAGGGQSEISGLLPYLHREFPNCDFQRVTPVSNKDGIKPNKLGAKSKTERTSQGLTGKSLLKEIEERLNHKFRLNDPICDLILIFDDLDYPIPNNCIPPVLSGNSTLRSLNKNVQNSANFSLA